MRRRRQNANVLRKLVRVPETLREKRDGRNEEIVTRPTWIASTRDNLDARIANELNERVRH